MAALPRATNHIFMEEKHLLVGGLPAAKEEECLMIGEGVGVSTYSFSLVGLSSLLLESSYVTFLKW